MSTFAFDINRVVYEDTYVCTAYNTITLYFVAPKEWLGDRYPEAIHSEISVEFPTDMRKPSCAIVMMSPTRLDPDGNGTTDYDWYEIELEDEHVEALMKLALPYSA